MDDKALLELWDEDTNAAMAIIIDLYSKLLWKVVRNILGKIATKELIEDTLSDTYFYLWRKFDKYDIEKRSFRNWLLMMAKSRARNMVKKIAHQEELSERIEETYIYHYELEVHETYADIKSVINTWPAPQREVSIRRFIIGMEPKEISLVMGIPINKINYYTYESKKKLKEEMAKYEV